MMQTSHTTHPSYTKYTAGKVLMNRSATSHASHPPQYRDWETLRDWKLRDWETVSQSRYGPFIVTGNSFQTRYRDWHCFPVTKCSPATKCFPVTITSKYPEEKKSTEIPLVVAEFPSHDVSQSRYFDLFVSDGAYVPSSALGRGQVPDFGRIDVGG